MLLSLTFTTPFLSEVSSNAQWTKSGQAMDSDMWETSLKATTAVKGNRDSHRELITLTRYPAVFAEGLVNMWLTNTG